MNSEHSFTMLIGEDYDWAAYGWQVIMNPKPSDLQNETTGQIEDKIKNF